MLVTIGTQIDWDSKAFKTLKCIGMRACLQNIDYLIIHRDYPLQ